MANKDFEELFGCLRRHDVKALIVGAHAVAFHARPRYTKDIDILIEARPDNARQLLLALDEFGFGSLDLSEDDFCQPGQIIQLGFEPNRVDFLTSLGSLDFDQAWRNRRAGTYGAESVYFLGREELIQAKREAGRPQDLADLDWLNEA